MRLPPLSSPALGPQDLTESALLEVLKRLPCFPPLQRLVGPGGRYRFGRMEATGFINSAPNVGPGRWFIRLSHVNPMFIPFFIYSASYLSIAVNWCRVFVHPQYVFDRGDIEVYHDEYNLV